MTGDIAPYLDLVTSEHNQRIKYMSFLAALLQGYADQVALCLTIPQLFDLDVSVGQQEDVDGEWVGISRYLAEQITDVFFSLDIDGLGFNQGYWYSPFTPITGIVRLDDETYRLIIRAKIGANSWDGTVADAELIYNEL